jgi:hypothetical protein
VRYLSLVPFEEDAKKRRIVIMGQCLRKVSFQNFMDLVTVANKRVNLIIQDLIVMDLKGATSVVKSEGFIGKLMNANQS